MFSKNVQSRFASVVIDTIPGPPCLGQHSRKGPLISVVPETTHEARRGPLKGAPSAQKALEGSEAETRGCWDERKRKVFPRMRGH